MPRKCDDSGRMLEPRHIPIGRCSSLTVAITAVPHARVERQVPNLEPELGGVAEYLTPQIVSQLRNPNDPSLQLLRDITSMPQLLPFLEAEFQAGRDARCPAPRRPPWAVYRPAAR